MRWMTVLTSLVLMAASALGQQSLEDLPDPFMGDYQGVLATPDGDQPLYAQVICWGDEGYQANLLPTLERRAEALAVLHGSADGETLRFEDGSTIEGGVFGGVLGESTFTLVRFLRLSPTLGAEPPEGAIVLFDGSGFDEWYLGGGRPWRVNLWDELGGGSQQVGYLRARIHSDREVPSAWLEVGSDDGVKAWVNGEVVMEVNTDRGITDFADRAPISLREGWNELLLKVTQNTGSWEACARISADEKGSPLGGLTFEPATPPQEDATFEQLQGGHAGTLITWYGSGPYREEGLSWRELFDREFAPEVASELAEWKVVNASPSPFSPWKLLPDGAMEVVGGAGSIVTKRTFSDVRLHLEFRTPFEPNNRGQGRGNSGVYLQGMHEVQVLDSYGLSGEDNECGGLYGVSRPLVNACAPPTVWQTFDIEYRVARFNEATGVGLPARISVWHNGMLIQDNVQLPGGAPDRPGPVPSGPILLQDHWNPVQYRNIWVMEGEPELLEAHILNL